MRLLDQRLKGFYGSRNVLTTCFRKDRASFNPVSNARATAGRFLLSPCTARATFEEQVLGDISPATVDSSGFWILHPPTPTQLNPLLAAQKVLSCLECAPGCLALHFSVIVLCYTVFLRHLLTLCSHCDYCHSHSVSRWQPRLFPPIARFCVTGIM